jgi:hypothetical protein
MRLYTLPSLVIATLAVIGLFATRSTAQHPHDLDLSNSISVDIEASPFHMFSRDITGARLIDSKGQVIEPEAELFRGNILFAELEPDVYTLRVDDPRFEPWSREGLEPGKRQVARIIPNSGVRLEVIDGATGAALPKYGLTVRYDRSDWRPNEYKLQSARRRPPKDGFHPMPAEFCTLLLSAKGYGPLEVTVEDLKLSEKRALTIRMAKAVRVSGRVLMHDGKPSPGGAFLHLRRPGDPVSHYEPGVSTTGPQPVVPLLSVRADEAGRFEISIAPGEYALHAIQDRWHSASIDPFVVTTESSDWEVLLHLPPAGRLEGRIVDGTPEKLAGYRVQASPLKPYIGVWLRSGNTSVPVQADGSFQFQLLPEGTTKLFAFKPSPETEEEYGWMDRQLIPLGEAEIAMLETQHAEFTIGDKLPSQLTITLRLDGDAGTRCVATIVSTDDSDLRTSVTCDRKGVASFEGVKPGTYRLHFGPRQFRRRHSVQWNSPIPGDLVIEPGTSVEIQHELTLVTGRVQFLKAEDGEPLTETLIELRNLGGTGPIGPTDAQGWLELSLPPGTYHFERTEDFVPRRMNQTWKRFGMVRWTATGPQSAQIEMSGVR